MEVSFIIPAYDEAGNIKQVVYEAVETLSKYDFESEIIVINDGSSDTTGAILDNLMKEVPGLVVINRSQNMGIGYTLNEGYSNAKGRWLFFNSADLQAPMDYFNILWKKSKEENLDFIVAAYPKRMDALLRIILSKTYSYLVFLFLGFRFQSINALKLFRRDIYVFDDQFQWTKSLCIDAELAFITRKLGLSSDEIKLKHYPREYGETKIVNVKRSVHTLLSLIWVGLKGHYFFFKNRKKLKKMIN